MREINCVIGKCIMFNKKRKKKGRKKKVKKKEKIKERKNGLLERKILKKEERWRKFRRGEILKKDILKNIENILTIKNAQKEYWSSKKIFHLENNEN